MPSSWARTLPPPPARSSIQNEMIQLLQYDPSTPDVHKKPLLIFPPWINKFYIMDLRPKNSLIKWIVDQGFTVFLMSWINPDEKMADWPSTTICAMDRWRRWMPSSRPPASRKSMRWVTAWAVRCWLSPTPIWRPRYSAHQLRHYLTTMLDFSQPGELEVFIEEEQIASLEKRMAAKGYSTAARWRPPSACCALTI
jgi:polyhydroxyalkanoate synthase